MASLHEAHNLAMHSPVIYIYSSVGRKTLSNMTNLLCCESKDFTQTMKKYTPLLSVSMEVSWMEKDKPMALQIRSVHGVL